MLSMALRKSLILRACEPFGGPLGPASARPSRQPLRGFLRMRFFLMPSRRYLILRRRAAPSRRTQDVRAAHRLPIQSRTLSRQSPCPGAPSGLGGGRRGLYSAADSKEDETGRGAFLREHGPP